MEPEVLEVWFRCVFFSFGCFFRFKMVVFKSVYSLYTTLGFLWGGILKYKGIHQKTI